MENENILVIDGVSKQYPDFALQDLSFQIPYGAVMGFIGENGAGKSTTIKLILDIIRRDAGRILLFGRDNREGKELREEIGVVFSELNLPEAMNALQVNRIMGGIYRGWEENTFFGLLSRFALKREMKIKAYSRGMKMKLAIAIALSHRARLLLLDEPTSGLDPVVRDEILDIFREFILDEHNGILISSHITEDLNKIADYITLIHQGRLLFCEEKDLLLDKYRLLKAPAQVLELLPPGTVVGKRDNRFGVEALVETEALARIRLPENAAADPAELEDIMLYHVRGGRHERITA